MVRLVDFIDSEICKRKILKLSSFAEKNPIFHKKTQDAANALFIDKDRESFLNKLNEIREEYAAVLGDNAPAVSLYLYSIGFPLYMQGQRELGIPEEIVTDTVRDINVWISNHKAMFHEDGFSQDGWILNHFLGELYQVGRLQYQITKYTNPTEVYRKDDSVLVAAKAGVELEEDGDCVYEKPAVKKTVYERKGDVLTAHFINKTTGLVSLEPETVNLSGWEMVLGDQEDVLSIHIPAIGKMDYALCKQSISQAVTFFQKYFPHYEIKGFICASWLLSNEVKEMLPPQSNIVQFSNLFTRNIAKGHYYLIDKWIFGLDVEDPLSVEPTSTLMRKTQALMKSGGQIYERGGFLLI
ncbi:acyltransferase domain-containing protein [Acetivibrio sp. MSJd-27]|uniref:acyltransferase domain-containing protein n=1 Tax=Acetivibrio sp. MSJd-27 TaxID=2841523 RepID=UPI001C10CF8A|nr:acyltransferase domain-containing protein [Acetivibrio sp. MSJd-27]MBU5450973.1 DUF5596 domain-containing protein [Acetivibrio sp. MSJd-27]